MIKIIKTIRKMKRLSASVRKKDLSIGLVPTMGCFHEGHMSLVRRAKKECDFVIVSIFVNPIQFGPKEDLKKYPRDFGRDRELLSKAGVDALFYPGAGEMYPARYGTYISVDELSDVMCGRSRPGHFRGVATVVAKLFNIIKPDVAYFGKKDFQQQVIIKKMVDDLNMDVKIVSMPTVREAGGLAMSSRNAYLSEKDMAKAAVISRALKFAKVLVRSGVRSSSRVRTAITKFMRTAKGLKIDYVAIRDPQSLEEKKVIKGKTLIAAAVYVGRTRLIDNILAG